MSDENFEENVETTEADAKQNLANLKSVGMIHFVAVMSALTLWGAADAWATVNDWSLAHVVAIVNAIIAGSVITGILHEWGHYAGARLAGSATQVLKKPVGYFFMFNFPFDRNDRRQFLWMSWGGIVVPWLLVVLTAMLVPIDTASRTMLLAVFVTRAAQVSFFEVPVARRARNNDPQKALEDALVAGRLGSSRYAGVAVGLVAYLVAW